MKIRYSKKFVKQLSKQPAKVVKALKLRIRLLEIDPSDPLLRNHQLQGELKGCLSINVTGDVRAIYKIIDGEVYFFVMIGTHSQLYG